MQLLECRRFDMDSGLIPLVAAIVTVVLLAGGCATVDGTPSAATHMPGTVAPTVGASGAPGETDFDWPASSR
jgi:hypothetical protein